ncbi:hypothetical protein PG988_000846 [Apiospora saccharicola]
MRHPALSGIFAALLGSTSAQQYGGGGGTGINSSSVPGSGSGGPGGSGSGGSGGPGGSGMGTCPLPEPTTVFVTITPAVVLPPPTTVTVTEPYPPFGYTSGVSAPSGPQWPSGWPPAESLTVPCATGPNGEPIPSVPGLVTVTYPIPGGSPGVGTFSLVTVPPASQSGYPGGPFGVSSSPGGPGGQGMSSIPGWGSFSWPTEPTVTVTAPVGTATWSMESYGATYPFPEPTLTLSYNPPPGGNGGGGQGGSSHLSTTLVFVSEGRPGGQGGSGFPTGTVTNPYALPTVTVTVPEGGTGGSSVPGGPEGTGGTYPFPEPTLTPSYNPPPGGNGGGGPGSYGGQGWTSVPEGSIGPSNPFPEVTITVPPTVNPQPPPEVLEAMDGAAHLVADGAPRTLSQK